MNEEGPHEPLRGCYYPGCDDEHARGVKFCPKHGGRWSAHAVLVGEEYEVVRR